ncbi:MAG: methylmalonate-semialdehyde dehydrogenase (acylating) [Gammaproteobacteria bacterium RIFCSPHIGHO2_12_FULL_45_9]|nr:MAG: methylmalonate-semialdehyde dehydrogenase (acylating) [Gammaproteobacteria bacterium RIFCSPHIGHO2_12_FULL_45_9]
MPHRIPHWIHNARVEKHTETSAVYNPAEGVVIAEVGFATTECVADAVLSAAQAFTTWSCMPPLKRARILNQFTQLLMQHQDQIAECITHEHGKVFADAQGEVQRGIELVEYYCGIPHLLRGEQSCEVANGMDCHTIRQPLGVCVGISPFNFPVMIPIWLMIPAIACGNTFVLKPSEKDPSATLLCMELLKEAGLPAGVANMIHGGRDVVSQLIAHPAVKAVNAVGSTPVVKQIYAEAIAAGKRSQTFGGAKNHAIVMPDAPIDAVADALVGAAFGAAGERCMALPVAVVVGDTTADQLIVALQTRVSQLRVGSGMDAVDMGPLIRREHCDRVSRLIESGIQAGARLVCDGRSHVKSLNPNGFFLGPCVFDHVAPDMDIYQEEIFGPVLCILRVPTFDAAILQVNSHHYGNGAAIFTNSGGVARRFEREVEAGMVGINVAIPVPVVSHSFGGWKQSWFGDVHMHGMEGIHFYTRAKSITSRWLNDQTGSAFHMPTHG